MNHDALRQMFGRVARAARVKASLVIVRGSEQNAWTDGNKVYLTTALLDSLPEDQVAAAVAHELGHIIGCHIPDTQKAIQELRSRVYGDQKPGGLQGIF